MLPGGTASAEELDDLAAVWSVARAACADPGVADDVTAAVLARARVGRRRGRPIPRGRLVTAAVREAVALSPVAALEQLQQCEREAVGLARFAGLSVDEIAAALDVEPRDVRTRLRDGLRAIADLHAAPGDRGPSLTA
jgi:hypothetical protein